MLRKILRHNGLSVVPIVLIALASNAMVVSHAYDEPSPKADTVKSTDSSETSEEKSDVKASKKEQAEKEFRTALQAELDRRGLTVDSVVCDTVPRRGSRIPTRECMTIAAWVEKYRSAKHEMFKLHANRAPRAWDTGP